MSNKTIYQEFCKKEENLLIFFNDWWLDAVAGKDYWDVVISGNEHEIYGVLPYYIPTNNVIKMPSLTPYLGPYIKYPKDQKYATKIAHEHKTMEDLINKLPNFKYFNQSCNIYFTNWLPFYWRGFKQSTKYTYILDNIIDTDSNWKKLQGNIKREIKKAQKNVQIKTDLELDKFLELVVLTFRRQNKKLPYEENLLYRIDNICKQKNKRKIFYAVDAKNRIHAAIYIIWDNHYAYYLVGGSDPELRTSGAKSLLIWEAINFASSYVNKFNFEGSMIHSIEKFFRAFGAQQVPYFVIHKDTRKKGKKALDLVIGNLPKLKA